MFEIIISWLSKKADEFIKDEISELKSEIWELEDKIYELEEQLDHKDHALVFTVSKEEYANYEKWWAEHPCNSKRPIWEFTPTGIGLNIQVSCSQCSETHDVSDYGSW